MLSLVAASAARADEYRYVEAGSKLEWATATAPLSGAVFGEFVVALLDAKDELPPDPPLVWQPPATAPFCSTVFKDAPCATRVGGTKERVTALRLRKTFAIGSEIGKLSALRLRARFQDGLVAWVNGVEIVRRNIEPTVVAGQSATRLHGPEWETFYALVPPGILQAGDNVLEVEVRPSVTRLAPTVDLELTGTDGARVVRGPLVQRVGADTATVLFETDVPTIGQVRYGTSAAYERTQSDGPEPGRRHAVTLTGLPPGGEVHYAVDVALPNHQPIETADYSFHTAPGEGEVVRFAVYGDVRSGHDTHARILKQIETEAPDFLVTTGDMVLRGSDEADWQKFFSVAGQTLARIPLYPAIGNHDEGSAGGDPHRQFQEIFELWPGPADRPEDGAWYSFDVSGVHFVMLDSNHYDDDKQLDWMRADLAAARDAGARAIFAATHAGPYSRGPHGGDSDAARKYVPVLQKYGVAVLFSGHDHLYQRGQVGSLRYVVSGGGGAELYSVKCGAKGKPDCKGDDGAKFVKSTHHYLTVEVFQDYAKMCAKLPDGTPLEECQQFDLPHP